jgi:hypothetical protein
VNTRNLALLPTVCLLLASLPGCFLGGGDDSSSSAAARTCPAPDTGAPWVPNVAGVAATNHDDTDVTVTKTVASASGRMTSYSQGFGSAQLFTFNVDMSQDLGSSGSLSLVAEVTGQDLPGQAYPVLVSLVDSAGNELVNLPASGGTLCGSSPAGAYTCDASHNCTPNLACAPDAGGTLGTAFMGLTAADRRTQWEQHQGMGTSDSVSVNSFPTCTWSSGSPACSFTTAPGNYFNGTGKLRYGGDYVAKYILLAAYDGDISSYSGSIRLTAIRKHDADGGAARGALDLNVVLVGSENIADSHTAKGQQNLDALLTHVVSHFGATNSTTTDIRVGQINVIEWPCANDGDVYATVDIGDTGQMFRVGSALMPAGTEGKALNIFLVSKIGYSGTGTILGLSAGITGAMINGTTLSGLTFATFGKLDTFNPSCTPGTACDITSQENQFVNMGSTISHELGHFLGLNHPSESSGAVHDPIPDTPTCSTVDPATSATASKRYITISSCRGASSAGGEPTCSAQCASYPCPAAEECQFNHIMWWTTKYYTAGVGDGNIFSTSSGDTLNLSPYVR